MDDITKRWTSRKFWAVMVWQAVICVLLWFGKLPVDAFESITWLLLGGYLGANVAQKWLVEKSPS